jgi:anti-sigma regulatory factor (Ser/Thr protein kinase)
VLTPAADSFRHEVAFYEDADGFLATTVPFVTEGLIAGEPVMVALGPEKTELVRAALGAEAERVRFEDIEQLGRNPARLLPAWREFAAAQPPNTALRGVGEPVWPRRERAEIEECHRHEALLNHAFGELAGVSLLCPYDSRALPDDVLQEALRTHPQVAGRDGAGLPSPRWEVGEGWPDPFAGELQPRPGDAPEFRYAVADLHELRGFAARASAAAGLSDERAEDLILAASELAANSIVHGGGNGRANAWSEDRTLFFEARDAGHITDPLVGRVRPTPTQAKGRGLWIANQLCDLVQIRSSAAGTAVRLRVELD